VGAQSHKIKASEDELLSDLTDLIRTQGEPFGSTSIYAQYRVFREAREAGVTVMLDGQGADEMLAGYIFYQGTKLAGLLRSGKFITATKFFLACIRNTSSTFLYLLQITVRELLSARLARTIKGLILPNKRTHWLSETWLLKESVSDARVFKRAVNWKNPLKTHLKSTLTEVGLPNLLRYEDRDSMRWSIESRVPFLHVELVEYLYSLPDEYLLNHQGVSKHVFREAMRGIVPDAILDRKDKIGFATPERDWLLKAGSWVDLKLTEAECLPFFNVPELKKEWDRVVSGEVPFDFRCWRWLNLISWASKKNE
jgi:asparagine synthase (glutamine-hydrolysing)